ncbi:MAG: geranylgeranylglycerol-phosphate geranylgeranyltransferase [Lutibacter sp.]|uniref:geranylgeranylglycerol-phosphate geranylgeranyltransferase n=1 Tax=Lutibacter sp. TaxID=1925666 RepID=UPI00299E3D68|nr:geranylgeranylglycerol-phosphate geranylgeranyltransferase [Lutibacter sp.]MDX1828106.1 geranylgeranylglycerol-phosphate geranylgeranyltransferase [Lutibacter sp.]
MKLVHFLNLIRWKNLLLITYVFFLVKFLLFPSLNTASNLTTVQFLLFWSAIIFITAAGYIINDINDVNTDIINKPDAIIVSKFISVKKVKNLYVFINSIGVFLGIIFSLNIKKPSFIFIFMGTSLLLNWYSKYLKSKPFIGNFLIAFLVAFSMLLIAILDINYQIENINQYITIIIIYALSTFSFFINLIRELVKDLEDIKGDYKLNMRTLPIIFGVQRILKAVSILTLIPIFLLLLIILNLDIHYLVLTIYLSATCLVPLIYISFKLWKLKSYKKTHKISVFLKIIMFLGINSIIIISLIK